MSNDARPPPGTDRELLTIPQAMARVRVSRRTIYNWLARGLLELERTASGTPRIYADSLWRTDQSRGQI